MKVRGKKAASRKGETPKPMAQPYSFPAPIRGWVLNENLAQVQPGGARLLDNWICTTTGIRVRAGCVKYATLGDDVLAMFSHKSGGAEVFFAATAGDIFDITTVADPDVAPTASLAGQTDGSYSTVQFGTAGGDFLVIANGVDDVQNFDGSAWSAPTITGITSADLSQVWSFASRLFFVEKDTMNAWYLPVDSIAGTVNQFSLAGVFTKGGSLLFGGKWSLDAGDGLDDKCVFVSTEGEVAVYEGTNPGSAADWARVGVYQLPKPMGKNAHIQAGGDLLIATEVGLIPISAAIQRDIAALDQSAVSRPIGPYWRSQTQALAGSEWQIVKLSRQGVMIVSQPDSTSPSCLAVNLQTGAWSRITGWDTQCLGFFDNAGYFGAADGCVYAMESGGSDNGTNYTCVFVGNHENMGVMQEKTILQMRPTFQIGSPLLAQITAQANFNYDISTPPASPADFVLSEWDVDNWDEVLWDGGFATENSSNWMAVGKTGHALGPELQLTFGVTPSPRVELVTIDVQFTVGAAVA